MDTMKRFKKECETLNDNEYNPDLLTKNDIDENTLKQMMFSFNIPQTEKVLITHDALEVLVNRNFKPILLNEFVRVIKKPYYELVKKFFGEYIAQQSEIDMTNIFTLIDLNFLNLNILRNRRTGKFYLISEARTSIKYKMAISI